MLPLYHLLIALIVALVLGILFAVGFRRAGPWAEDEAWWTGMLIFVLLIFLASWSGGIWVGPVGPAVRGVAWLPFFVSGLIVALLLAAATPPQPRRARARAVEPRTEQEALVVSAAALEVFVWVLFVVLIAAIAARYIY